MHHRPAVSTSAALSATVSLCNTVAILDGGSQAIVDAMASVLPPLIERQRASIVQSFTMEETLLVANNVAWLPSAIIVRTSCS